MFRNLFFVAILALAGLTSATSSRAAPSMRMDNVKTAQMASPLPVGKFFAYSSTPIFAFDVILAEKGVSALQEADILFLPPLPLPKIERLDIYPTVESIAAQAIVLAIVLFAFRGNRNLLTEKS